MAIPTVDVNFLAVIISAYGLNKIYDYSAIIVLRL